MSSKNTFGYWNLRGIAYPIKLALAYLGVDYEDKRYGLDSDGLAEWGKNKFNLNLDFPNLPYWKDGSQTLTETRAILKSIARKYGSGSLMPVDVLFAQAEMVESVLWDVWQLLIKRCFHNDDHFKTQLNNNAPPKFEQLNKFGDGKKWILGDKLSYVDFILYEILYHYTKYDPEYLKSYPNLLTLKENFEAIPQIQAYITSPANIPGPCFHPKYVKHKI